MTSENRLPKVFLLTQTLFSRFKQFTPPYDELHEPVRGILFGYLYNRFECDHWLSTFESRKVTVCVAQFR